MRHTYSFCYVVLNGGYYLWYSLLNTLDLCNLADGSEIIVIEGSDNFYDQSELKNGLSVDGTGAIINSFQSDRIKHVKLGKVGDRRHLLNEFLKHRGDMDYIFLREEDEIIKPEDFLRIDQRINNTDVVDLKHIDFWGDFGYKIPDSFSSYSEKIIKNIGGIGFVEWHKFIEVVDTGKFRETGTFLRMDVPIYRYGSIRSLRRFKKDRTREIKEKNWYHRSIRQIPTWKVVDPIEWIEAREPFFQGGEISPKLHFSDLEPVTLEYHPKIMRNHPFSGLTREAIHSQPAFLTLTGDKGVVLTHSFQALRILEFGSGPGLVLSHLNSENECWGLDPSLFAVQHGRKLGLKMVRATLEEAWFPKNSFDLVFGIDAFEHVKNPIKAIKNLSLWLKPGGALIMTWPDPEASWTQDKRHFLWSPLQHFSVPSKGAIKNLVSNHNLEVVNLMARGTNLWMKALKRND